MLNIRKRFFLLLTIVGLLFGIAACTNNDDYVRLSFDNDVYEVKVGQTIDVTPIVNKGSNVGAVTIEYTSYDDQIASYSNGKLQGLRVGETVIKVVCSEKPVAYDVATVRVVANSLPEVEFELLQQNMLKGTTQTLKYHFVPEYGNALMSFTSANPEIATIDENGVITGVAKGTAVIIARATDELDSSQYRDYTFVVEVLEVDFAITYELNGGTNDPTNPAGYNVLNLPIILKDATKLGHNFVGWYDNPEFSGSPITEIAANSTGDMTLYAKWEVSVFDITYELNGGINASENPDSYDVNKLPLVLGEPTKTGYNFIGWYLDDEKIDSIVEGTTGEIKLVAQWEIATYNITFDLVGGSWQDLTGIEWPYNRDRNQMVADFIVDFNKHSGKTVAADGSDFFARSWMADGSSAGYKFLTSTEYGSKWGWLLDFINDNRLANGKTALNENDNQAEARGELHNFLNACAPGDKGGNASYGCDYSTEEGTTGFWLYMVDLEEVSVPKTYTVESEDIILPEIAYKMGYTFLGWFLNGEKVEKIVKGTTGDLNFVAEWEIVEYTIEYNLNGGLFDIYLYSSREEMVDDFLTDAMAYYNKDKKPNCMVDDSETQVGFANVFTAIYGIFSSEEYGAKWAWLKEYIIYTATDAKASLESGSEAYWRYSLGAFLFEDHRASWPASADYTNDELANGFWSLLLKEGAVGPQYTYTVNDEVILLTPTKEGSVFLGWFLNGEKIEKISKGTTGNLVLEAKWYNPDAELDIEYQLDGGVLPEGAPTTFVAKDGLAILPTPIKVGYMFKGWYEDIECTKEVTSIASGRSEGVVLYALWELETYKIEYETNGGEFLTDSVAPLYATFDELVLEFINDYSSFTGISGITAESFYGKSNQYGLYGFFKNEEMATKWNWLLNFVADMATEVGYSGKAYLMLSAGAANFNKYSRSNFAAFLQQTHLTKISPISMNFENVDSEALWAVCPTKDIQIGIEAQYEYTILDLPLELATPNKEGATFIGWYTNSDLKNGKIDKLTVDNIGNIKLYARWSDSTIHFDTFNINYVLDGGTLPENAPISFKEGTSVNLVEAIKDGAFFAGWYDNPELTGNPITIIESSVKNDITLYAKWTAYNYKNINYVLDGGTLSEDAPTNYVVTVGVDLSNVVPTKDGYKFLGWFDNAEGLGNPITEISKDAEEDITLYALWQDETINFDVTYVLNGGNTKWDSRDALIAEFLSDFSSIAGKTITAANFTTAAREAEFNALIKDDAMWAKWKWLFEFIASTDKHEKAPDFYNKVLNDRDGSDPDNKWFLTRDFAGFVNKTIGNFWFSVSPVDYSLFVNADGFWNLIETEYKDVDTNTLLTPYRPYYVFEGWYDNPELTGNPVKVIESDCTLYAKWSKQTVTLTYVIGDVDATIDQPEVLVHVSDSFDLVTPTYDDRYLKFNGWYLEPECINPVTKVNEYTNSDLMVYASWTEIDGYTINYVLNGGSLIYEDRDALLADFLKDYNEAMGKSYQTTADIPTGAFADNDYHTFFTKVLSDGTNIRGKWLWLAEYLLELSKRDLASNNCNVLGLTALINNNAYTGDAIYGLSYAFRAFLIGTTIRPGSSYSSVDHSIYENAHGFWDKLSAAENTEYLNNKGTVTLPTAYLENYKFVGWYTNPEFTGEVVTTVEDTITVYAKFVEATPVESVSIDNKITELKRYETYQLEWSINPSNANIQAVKFESSDTSVATVDNKGLITAVSNGTVTIKMTSLSPSGKTDEFTFEVYSPDHFDINYETNSYVEIGKSILLLADYVKRDGSKVNLVWSSLTPEIASVDAGAVTGLKAGQAVIRVALADDANIYQDFVVTVLDSNLSDALKYVLSAHESNAFLSYDLGIGAGTPAYYRDIVGSVSKLLYNEPLTINDQYYATANANEKNHGGKMSSIEFITVHYTGNMAKGSTASANANYFATNTSTSIHYVTGNDGVFSVLDDSYVAYHAGDGTSVKFEWFPTGVTYKDGDPVYPVFGITANSKFSINGTETTISVPEGTTAATKKVTDSKWINDMGLAFKIVDGQYYMGTTWWCYSQVAEGRICSKGGNLNSIGIESAVNPESNLWYTWQRTAQLVAKLMLENDLDITRVKGHHFYSAKDCPQPLLENDLEIWWKFIEMVEHEYDMLTKYKDYQFTFELDTETTAVNNNGRVVEQPLYTEVVTYTVTIDNGTTSETITLSTIVEGMYCK